MTHTFSELLTNGGLLQSLFCPMGSYHWRHIPSCIRKCGHSFNTWQRLITWILHFYASLCDVLKTLTSWWLIALGCTWLWNQSPLVVPLRATVRSLPIVNYFSFDAITISTLSADGLIRHCSTIMYLSSSASWGLTHPFNAHLIFALRNTHA